MRNRFIGSILAVVALLAFSPVVLAQTAGQSRAAQARTAAPTPDLSGVWSIPYAQLREGVIPAFGFTPIGGEEPPMQPWAAELYKTQEGRPQSGGKDELDPIMYCFPPGIPRAYLSDEHPFEIVQMPGRLYMIFEINRQARAIYTDGRRHPEGAPSSFMGHSVGRWEGDTLVVETVGLNDLTWLDGLGHPHTDALRVEERIRRMDQDTLEINFLFDDPKAYTKPWTGKKGFKLRPNLEIMEQNFCEDRLRELYLKKTIPGTNNFHNF